MGHGKWTAPMILDIQKSSESLRMATRGGITWCGKKPGSLGVSNQHIYLLLHLSVSVHFHVWLCTHMNFHMFKTKTYNCWMFTEELKPLQLGIRWSFPHRLWVWLPQLLPRSPGSLIMPPWMSKAPMEQEPNSTPLTSVSHALELSSSPHLPSKLCSLTRFLSQVFSSCWVYHLFIYYLNSYKGSEFHRAFPGQHSKD